MSKEISTTKIQVDFRQAVRTVKRPSRCIIVIIPASLFGSTGEPCLVLLFWLVAVGNRAFPAGSPSDLRERYATKSLQSAGRIECRASREPLCPSSRSEPRAIVVDLHWGKYRPGAREWIHYRARRSILQGTSPHSKTTYCERECSSRKIAHMSSVRADAATLLLYPQSLPSSEAGPQSVIEISNA